MGVEGRKLLLDILQLHCLTMVHCSMQHGSMYNDLKFNMQTVLYILQSYTVYTNSFETAVKCICTKRNLEPVLITIVTSSAKTGIKVYHVIMYQYRYFIRQEGTLHNDIVQCVMTAADSCYISDAITDNWHWRSYLIFLLLGQS